MIMVGGTYILRRTKGKGCTFVCTYVCACGEGEVGGGEERTGEIYPDRRGEMRGDELPEMKESGWERREREREMLWRGGSNT